MLGLALGQVGPTAPELGDAKAGQARLGLGPAPGGALVADFAAGAGGGPGKGRDGGGVVVRFHLHQNVLLGSLGGIDRHRIGLRHARHEALQLVPLHHGGVVGIGHDGVLRVAAVGVADHAKQAVRLRLAVDHKFGIENFVAAVLAVGLRKHHQLHIARVAAQRLEGRQQVVDFVFGQRQAPGPVGLLQCGAARAEQIDVLQRRRGQLAEQLLRRLARGQCAFGHAVVQQRRHLLPLGWAQAGGGAAKQAAAQLQAVFGAALDAAHSKTAVARNVGGLGGPGRYGA